MSKLINILYKIFDDHYIVKSPKTIDEPSEKMSRVLCKGNGIPDDNILVCRLDQEHNQKMKDPFPYLRGSKMRPVMGLKGMKRICDYVIFVDKDDKLYVLLVELKKGDESPQEQLNLTEPLIDFIFKRAFILDYLHVEYVIRKIGITDEPDKRRTSYRGSIDYNEDNYVKLYSNRNFFVQRMLH